MEKSKIKEELTKFVQFGCWNNINDKWCLEKVMNKLNEYVDSNPPNFILVTGDNYYPQKEKIMEGEIMEGEIMEGEKIKGEKIKGEKMDKKEKDKSVVEKNKIIILNDINYGFELMPKHIPIYTILGNHDLETDKPNLFVADSINPDAARRLENTQCEILQKEMETIKNLSSNNYNISYDFFKSIKLANNTLLLMMDTSIYEKFNDSNKYLHCYQIFSNLNPNLLPSPSNEITIDTLRAYQLTKIQEAINTGNYSNIIMAGHHPIQQLKLKKGKNIVFTDITDFQFVLKEIYNLTPTSNFYYLCSDLHLYQEGTIRLPVDTNIMTIKQYIVGTGGTELDPLPLTELNNNYDIYNVITSKFECGFLECDVSSGEPRFTFITAAAPISNANAAPISNANAAPYNEKEFIGGKRAYTKKRHYKKSKSKTGKHRRNTRKKHKKYKKH